MIERNNPFWTVTKITSQTSDLKECSTFWIMLIVSWNVQFSHQEALLCVFEDNEAVPQWDMFPRPTELRLIGCSIELIWTPKSKSNTSTPKANSPTFWQKGISRVMNGIICCACSISAISGLHFVLLPWQKVYNKIQEKNESQRNREQWRKLKQGLPRICHPQSQKVWGREKLWKSRSLECESWEREDRTVQPVVRSDPRTVPDCYHEQSTESSLSARYSKWVKIKAWYSQEWTADRPMGDRTGNPLWLLCERHKSHNHVPFMRRPNTMEQRNPLWTTQKPRDRTEQPVGIPQREARPQQFIIRNDETESELSLESRSFWNKVNDQVRKKPIFDECCRKLRETMYDIVVVHVCNIGIGSIHGKEVLGKSSFNHENNRSHIETNVS